MRYDIQLPARVSLAIPLRPGLTIAPDGNAVVFAGSSSGGTQLYLRKRNETETHPLPGTEAASDPVFSPDGKWVLFAAGLELKKALVGGPPVTIAPLADSRGAAWLDDGTIVYSPDGTSGLMRVPADGGRPVPLTTVDTRRGERTHRWPATVPGGKAVLFVVGDVSSPDDYDNAPVDAVVLATGERRRILTGARFVRYAAPGYLLFVRGGTLHAVRFDPQNLSVIGAPVPVVSGIGGDPTTGAAAFATAEDGTLVYAGGGASGPGGNVRRLIWADRSGVEEAIDVAPAVYSDPRLSPDGTKFAVLIGASGSGDVWTFDVARKALSRLTFDHQAATPVWSADGKTVFYASVESGNRTTLRSKPVDGSRDAETVATINGRAFLGDLSRDGTLAIVEKLTSTSGMTDIVTVRLDGSSTAAAIVATPADEAVPQLSPDGRWLAYNSRESGRDEVYVRDFTGGSGRWQISTAGGAEPHWSADGTEIFYRVDDRLMRVSVSTRGSFQANTPVKLLDGVYNLQADSGFTYDLNRKAGRFLMMRPADAAAASPSTITVVLNWFDEVQRLVAHTP
jgi:serine/threonine-protein kinase